MSEEPTREEAEYLARRYHDTCDSVEDVIKKKGPTVVINALAHIAQRRREKLIEKLGSESEADAMIADIGYQEVPWVTPVDGRRRKYT